MEGMASIVAGPAVRPTEDSVPTRALFVVPLTCCVLAPNTPSVTARLGTGWPEPSRAVTISRCAWPTVAPGRVVGASESEIAGGSGVLIAAPPPPIRVQDCDSLPRQARSNPQV